MGRHDPFDAFKRWMNEEEEKEEKNRPVKRRIDVKPEWVKQFAAIKTMRKELEAKAREMDEMVHYIFHLKKRLWLTIEDETKEYLDMEYVPEEGVIVVYDTQLPVAVTGGTTD